jgi:RNA polymerase sigma-70 factor (ECF subfamily)
VPPTPANVRPEAADADLVRRCRAGEDAAWAALVERYSRYVLAIAVQGYRLDRSDAEDVFQEVFARAFQRLASLRDDGAVRPWLAQMTRNACVDRLRSGTREQPADHLDDGGAEDAALARVEEAMAVRGALATLPETCREILDRFFARDESYHAIAAELGIPQGTIASRISRCLTRLKAAYAG